MSYYLATYVLNALWQIPLFAFAAWITVALLKPKLRTQHGLWIAALVFSVMLPLRNSTPAQLPSNRTVDSMLEALPQPQVVSAQVESSPAPRAHLPSETIPLSSNMQSWLAALFVLALAISALRLAWAYCSLRRMVRNATPFSLTREKQRLLDEASSAVNMHAPSLAMAETSAGPLVVGVSQPRILIPPALLDVSEQEFQTILLHELAHIRRRDFAANALLKCLALPIALHPATLLIDTRIRQTREMLCDEFAAQHSRSGAIYARSLLSLSRRLLGSGILRASTAAPGLFNHTASTHLEERIMKLIAPTSRPSFRIVRLTTAGIIAVAALTVASVVHLTPAVLAAQQPTQAVPQPAPATTPAPSSQPQTAAGAHATVHHQRKPTHAHSRSDDHSSAAADLPPMPKVDLEQFNKSMAELNGPAMKKLQANLNQQMAELNKTFKDPKFQLQMKQLAETAAKMPKIDTAAIQARVNEQMKILSSPEFQQRMADAQRKVAEARLNPPELEARIAEAARRQAEASQQLAKASAKIAEARAKVQDQAVQKQLEDAQKAIDQARAARAH